VRSGITAQVEQYTPPNTRAQLEHGIQTLLTLFGLQTVLHVPRRLHVLQVLGTAASPSRCALEDITAQQVRISRLVVSVSLRSILVVVVSGRFSLV